MLYFSTNKNAVPVDFKRATITGLAPDKGLYFPETIPLLSSDFFKNLKNKTKEQIAYEIISPYVGNSIPPEDLFNICKTTVDFNFPLKNVKFNAMFYLHRISLWSVKSRHLYPGTITDTWQSHC